MICSHTRRVRDSPFASHPASTSPLSLSTSEGSTSEAIPTTVPPCHLIRTKHLRALSPSYCTLRDTRRSIPRSFHHVLLRGSTRERRHQPRSRAPREAYFFAAPTTAPATTTTPPTSPTTSVKPVIASVRGVVWAVANRTPPARGAPQRDAQCADAAHAPLFEVSRAPD